MNDSELLAKDLLRGVISQTEHDEELAQIGMRALHEGVPTPAAQDAAALDSIIINPSFVVQEMAPKDPDPRGKRGAAIRVKVTDDYVETTIRSTGARMRVYYNPKA